MKTEKKIHFAPSGEWGSTKVFCTRHFTSDVLHTMDTQAVTCKRCLKLLCRKN